MENDELRRSNESKDQQIDELTKQVLRFKRIQEMMLNGGGGSQLASTCSPTVAPTALHDESRSSADGHESFCDAAVVETVAAGGQNVPPLEPPTTAAAAAAAIVEEPTQQIALSSESTTTNNQTVVATESSKPRTSAIRVFLQRLISLRQHKPTQSTHKVAAAQTGQTEARPNGSKQQGGDEQLNRNSRWRMTTGGRLQTTTTTPVAINCASQSQAENGETSNEIATWSGERVCAWLREQGFHAYVPASCGDETAKTGTLRANAKRQQRILANGLTLLNATNAEYEKVNNNL